MKGRWLVFILIAVIGLGLAAVQGADGTTLTILAVEVEAGTSQTYEIAINCLEDGCIAFDLTLSFDPALVQIDDVRVGPYLGEDAVEVDSNINNEAGTVRLAAVALGQLTQTQDNILLHLDFTPLGSGKVEFTVDHLDMSNRQGLPIEVEIVDEVIAQPTVPVPVVTCEYTVKTGDTMTGIALANDVTIDAIMTLNNMTNASFIYPGQILLLPSERCEAGLSSGSGGTGGSGNTIYEPVWFCDPIGGDWYRWYGVNRIRNAAGEVIEEVRVDGPHEGSWQPNCPGTPPSNIGGDDDDGGGSSPGDPPIPA